MKSPQEMHNIQIDITNACLNTCSNCTRFCGHHTKPFFMSVDYFKKAVDSLREFPKVVGLIGGEPTLHPKFVEMATYMGVSRLSKPTNLCRLPVADMSKHMHTELIQHEDHACGLWSMLGTRYRKHFEIISDTFGYQILNDHKNACKHQALLMSRKDFGISDEEWTLKRDSCWIQNSWSATITPKGAFFCEVAGALDMLFDGPGGWDITDHNWWKRQPHEFGDQLNWCEMCGAALDTPSRISNDGRDDISKTLLENLLKIKSPKIKKGLYVEYAGSLQGETFKSGDEYISGFETERIKVGEKALYPQTITIVPKGRKWAKIKSGEAKDWILLPQSNICLNIKNLTSFIFNPGCLYILKGKWVFFNVNAHALYNVHDFQVSLTSLKELYPKRKQVELNVCDFFGKLKIINRFAGVFR